MNTWTHAFLLTLSFLCSSLSFGSQAQEVQRILLMNSYDPGFPTTQRRLEGFFSVFEHANVIIDIEFMDSKRHFNEKVADLYLLLLKEKLAQRPAYDLVVTSDDNALRFAQTHRDTLFPKAAIVFNGLNDEKYAEELQHDPTVTGVTEDVSVAKTLALISQLQPRRTHLHVIVDASPSGQADLQRVKNAIVREPHLALSVIALSELSWAEYAELLETLGEHDAILLLSAFRDKNGHTLLFKETLRLLVSHTQSPIFHLWEHGLGEGVLGGYLINQFEQGRQAALMAKDILQGKTPSEIPILMGSTNQAMFDYTLLQRFGVSTRALPENAEVLFTPKSLWNTHRLEIILVLFTLVILLLIALYLARETLLRTRLAHEFSQKSTFLETLMNALPDLVWLKNLNGVYLACNRRFEEFYGADEKDILGKTDYDFVKSELARLLQKNDQDAFERGQPMRIERRLKFKSDGHEELLETIKTPLIANNGEIIGVLGISRDISGRVLAEEKIRTLLHAIEQSPVSVMIISANYKIEYVNRSFEKISGYSKAEALGKNPLKFQAENTSFKTYRDIRKTLNEGNSWEGELRGKKKDGTVYWEYTHMSPIQSDDGMITGYLSVKEDITLKRQQEERILFQAQYDSLTLLPNRSLSLDRLKNMIARARELNTHIAVLYLDLDDFKKVNDTLGHSVGDKLLVHIAKRLHQISDDTHPIGRLGGDEFIVLLEGKHISEEAGIISKNIIQDLGKPIYIDERSLSVSASIGIALYPDDGADQGELLRKADLAMYSAKNNGRSNYAFYTASLNEAVERRFAVEQQLRNALERNEFFLVYQPKIDLNSETLVGFEALIRWQNPSLGTVSPFEFISIAEQTGAILPIGDFVIDTAFKQLSRLNTTEYLVKQNQISLAINLSPRQFRNPQLAENIITQLNRYELAPECIELELTEGLFLDDHAGIQESLSKLHLAGIRLAMDDFGTGYSSLSYLRHYPFSTLKIDREFVQGINEDPADKELVFAAISMAHSLGLTVVAEGVETEAQRDILLNMQCDIAQGYLYAKPMAEAELDDYLLQKRIAKNG